MKVREINMTPNGLTGGEDLECVTVIRPTQGLRPPDIRELWAYRELIFFFLWRDLKGRYKQTALGPLWMLLAPLMNMVIYTLIFGIVADFPSDGIPYPIFNYSALLPWTFFSACLFQTAGCLVTNRNLLSKIYYPRLIPAIVAIFSALVDFTVSFLVLLGMMAFYGYAPGPNIIWLPLYLLAGATTGVAVGLWWAPGIVHYWDLSTVLNYIGRVWMYACPIIYPASMIPKKLLFVYRLNPIANLIEGVRWCLFGVGDPSHSMMLISMAIVLLVLISGGYYFRMSERSIVDIA